ncbi:hypothetical protein EMIT0158MI4_230047 [Burkholderia ambifaria]
MTPAAGNRRNGAGGCRTISRFSSVSARRIAVAQRYRELHMPVFRLLKTVTERR